MGWIARQLIGGSRDPWWDPDGRSRRRSAPRRFLELTIVAFVLASLVLGLQVGTARGASCAGTIPDAARSPIVARAGQWALVIR